MDDPIRERIKNKDPSVVDDPLLIEYISPNGETSLHWGCAYNNLPVVKKVISYIHVDQENYRGTTPLYYACMSGSTDAIEYMLSMYANPCIRSGFSGEMPIEHVKDREMIDLINSYINKNIPIEYPSLKPRTEKFSMFQCFKYRRYMHLLSNFNWSILPDHMKPRRGVDLVEEIDSIKELCDEAFEEYITYIDEKGTGGLCLWCNSDGAFKCGKCGRARYCSIECQRECHKYHKYDCKYHSVSTS